MNKEKSIVEMVNDAGIKIEELSEAKVSSAMISAIVSLLVDKEIITLDEYNNKLIELLKK